MDMTNASAVLARIARTPAFRQASEAERADIGRRRRAVADGLRNALAPAEAELTGARRRAHAAAAKLAAAEATRRAAAAASEADDEVRRLQGTVDTLKINAERKLQALADPRVERVRRHVHALHRVALECAPVAGEAPPASMLQPHPEVPKDYRHVQTAVAGLRALLDEVDAAAVAVDDAGPRLHALLDHAAELVRPIRMSAAGGFPVFDLGDDL